MKVFFKENNERYEVEICTLPCEFTHTFTPDCNSPVTEVTDDQGNPLVVEVVYGYEPRTVYGGFAGTKSAWRAVFQEADCRVSRPA